MTSDKGNTVVVLPGSKWQVPLVQRLSNEGCRVLAVNPYADSPTFAYTDGHLRADIFDIDAVADYCQREGATALLSDECDIAMPVVAEIGKRLGMRALSPESADLFTDKHLMRQFCDKHGFASPSYKACKTIEEANAFMESSGYPKVVVKPLDANSSRGVSIVDSLAKLPAAFEEALRYAKEDSPVLVERFVAGREFTVDGVKTPEGHVSLAISKKAHYAHNESIACELYFAHEDTEYDYDELRRTNDALLNASPLEFGLTHCEYKYEDGRFYLIEMAARGGGNLISSHIVPFLSGFDNYGYLIESALHAPKGIVYEMPASAKGNHAVLRFFDCPASGKRVTGIIGEDLLRDDPGILAYGFNFSIGEIIADAANDAARIGFYIATGRSKEELAALVDEVERSVRIECAE